MDELLELRKELLLFEQDLIRFHDRLVPLLGRIVEAIIELDSRIRTLEDDGEKKAIAFEAKKLGVSEEQFLAMVAEYIRRKMEEEDGL